jgi:hypothetical protein
MNGRNWIANFTLGKTGASGKRKPRAELSTILRSSGPFTASRKRDLDRTARKEK